ncbi:MAG: hypothetical protein ACM3VS_12450 [Candidatus Dadabacteria bacterium]
MKKNTINTAVLTRLKLPASIIEQAMDKHTGHLMYFFPVHAIPESMSDDEWDAVGCCSAEANLRATLKLGIYNVKSDVLKIVDYPVSTSLLLTCCRTENGTYKLAFSSSLS